MKKDLHTHLIREPKHKPSPDKETHYNNVIDQKGLLFPLVEATAEVVPDNGHSQAWDQVIWFDI